MPAVFPLALPALARPQRSGAGRRGSGGGALLLRRRPQQQQQRHQQQQQQQQQLGAFLILGVFLLDQFANTGIIGTILMYPINYSVMFLSQERFPMIIEVLKASFAG